MRARNVSQKIFAGSLSGSLYAILGCAMSAIAQVPNADLACYLHSVDGHEYDLSALCSGFNARTEEVILQTGDVQVTLRWETADDLDLFVRDPFAEEVSYLNPAIPSGGQLDVDANAGCAQRMATPVENIFWPTGGGVPGDYVVTVDLFSYCGNEAPVNFTLTTLIQGQTQTQSGSVSAGQTSMSFPFTFPAATTGAPAVSDPSDASDPSGSFDPAETSQTTQTTQSTGATGATEANTDRQV